MKSRTRTFVVVLAFGVFAVLAGVTAEQATTRPPHVHVLMDMGWNEAHGTARVATS
ncbi:hypothetical protein [Kitasatospora sp. HPMI-4]|uniref:hypothetical protein n=1 Tax=Kitasatospora sp. HPMI-4 TaxID=3448443 RepID=UPI003F1BEEB5